MPPKINLIDPSSTEFNRGSFCYAPYLCYNGLNALGFTVSITETFQAEDLDALEDADVYVVCLWSYPQIEAAMLLTQMIPFEKGYRTPVYFVGYRPLIEHLGLPYISEYLGFDPMQDNNFLMLAMKDYPHNYSKFKRLLLSDCDMHIQDLPADDLVYPLFTTYGCPNGCSFCPSTANCNRGRIVLDMKDTQKMLTDCLEQGIQHIHFTDEDFFYDIDRAYKILRFLKGKEMSLIALSSAKAAWQFIQKYGIDVLHEGGLKVLEVGFESASAAISTKMGAGKSLNDCNRLANIQDMLPFNIFWLVQTFFPGETITSLNTTGQFLQKYGLAMDEVVGRLRTNGTKGGLGQFFQPYHGTPIYKKINEKGIFLTERPIRLVPSFVPHSFLDSVITKINKERFDSAVPWLKLYNCTINLESIEINTKISDHVLHKPTYIQVKTIITFAVLARMEVIQ